MSADIHEFPDKAKCKFCGGKHKGDWCPLIEAIEYHEDGETIFRVEFREAPEVE